MLIQQTPALYMLLGTIISILRGHKHGTTLGIRREVSIDSVEMHIQV
jgi:hypothetical protein